MIREHLWCAAPLLLAACQAAPGGGFVTAASTTKCSDQGAVQHGVDVSSYEGSINWPTAKAAGWSFGVAKVSEGLTYTDPTFAANWAGLRAAGVVRGAYHFMHADDDGKAQADRMLDLIDAQGGLVAGDLPPTLDLEVTDGESSAQILQVAGDFISEVRARIGRPPILYTYLSFWEDTLGDPKLSGVPLWIAVYNGQSCPQLPNAFSDWTMWQYSESTSVPGIGTTDADLFNGSFADLQAFAGGARIVTNNDAQFSSSGAWVTSTSDPGYDGANYLVIGTGTQAWAAWGLYFSGSYELFARYTPDANRTSKALYRVRTSANAAPVAVRVDQRSGGRVSLGTFTLGTNASVSVDASDADGYTVANAIEAEAR